MVCIYFIRNVVKNWLVVNNNKVYESSCEVLELDLILFLLVKLIKNVVIVICEVIYNYCVNILLRKCGCFRSGFVGMLDFLDIILFVIFGNFVKKNLIVIKKILYVIFK